MTEQSFSLIPFPAPNIPEISITGTVSRQSHFISLRYMLTGQIEEIFLPLPSSQPRRTEELWKTTCFEFFLASKDQPQYWEFNMSPSGDWNIYRMDAYRRVGFREEPSIPSLQFEVQRKQDALALNALVDLIPIFREDAVLEVGMTAVIQTKEGDESYWALTHPAPQPDFHLRESFILALPAHAAVPSGGSQETSVKV